MKIKKKLIIFLIPMILIAIGGFYAYQQFIASPIIEEVPIEIIKTEKTLENSLENSEETFVEAVEFVPTFTEVPLDFAHVYNKKSLALIGGSMIDVNNDGTDEIFLPGGIDQPDALFFYENGALMNRISGTGLSNNSSTHGSISLDVDADGDTDLFVTRENNIYLYFNDGSGVFKESIIDLKLEEHTVPLSLAAGDINKDGKVDLYVSTFVDAETFTSARFNDSAHAKANVMLLNNGDNTFTDITESSGTHFDQNTFISSFVDLDNDGWQDLIVTPNTDRVTVFRNKGDNTFEKKDPLTDEGFWMGLAIADVDQDGDQDFLVTNIGITIQERFARGDLEKSEVLDSQWRYFRNDGNFEFVDATESVGLLGYEFAWGAIFEDFNLNGRPDLSVLENYVKWPAHKLNKLPGRFFYQQVDGLFSSTTKQSGLENFYYGMSPLVSDLNRDGYPDIVFVNLDGPARAFINNGGENHAITIILPDTADSLGANVMVTNADGTKITKQFITSVGLLSDQTAQLIFGIGQSKTVPLVEVRFPSGEIKRYENVNANEVITVK